MAKLTETQKLFVVQELARFRTPTEVVDALQGEHGVAVPRQQIEAYDPDKKAGRKLSTKWTLTFRATREKYLEDVSAVPLAHRGYRLQQLQKLLDKALEMGRGGNVQLAKELIIEAEKIMGELYTNRHKLDVTSDGKAIPSAIRVTLVEPDDEED